MLMVRHGVKGASRAVVVAYADRVRAAAISGVLNQGDHQMVVKALPVAMEHRLKAMLQKKDHVQYGASFEPGSLRKRCWNTPRHSRLWRKVN
jgi:uncharacterized protein (UPF0303 family)